MPFLPPSLSPSWRSLYFIRRLTFHHSQKKGSQNCPVNPLSIQMAVRHFGAIFLFDQARMDPVHQILHPLGCIWGYFSMFFSWRSWGEQEEPQNVGASFPKVMKNLVTKILPPGQCSIKVKLKAFSMRNPSHCSFVFFDGVVHHVSGHKIETVISNSVNQMSCNLGLKSKTNTSNMVP